MRLLALLPFLLLACTPKASPDLTTTDTSILDDVPEVLAKADLSILDANPATKPFDGPYGGVPNFDEVTVADLEPALLAAMKKGLLDIEQIAENPDAPTFDNTVAAMERAGQELSRAANYFGIFSGTLSDEDVRAIEKRISPLFSAYSSTIIQNAELFERIRTLHEDEDAMAALTPEQQRLVWDYYTDFTRAGAALDEDTKAEIAEIDERLSELYTAFRQNLLHDEQSYVTYLDADQLGGLPESFKAAAKAAAEAKGQPDKWAVTNTRSSMDPFLTYSTERDLREEVWRTYYDRGDNGDEYDNNALITEILRLREQRSKLQGYDNFAERAVEKSVAKTPEAAMALMMKVWPAAKQRVREEVADMQALADGEGAGITIAPWDYRYYAEKVRQDRYDFDAEEVKQYLQLEKLREGMFFMADTLYGLKFEGPLDTDEVPVYHPDVRVWKVNNREGELVGLWYFDPYAREGKRSGAWMNAYRMQRRMDGEEVKPIVSNNSNFVKGAPGEPVLISWDDATTLFHEFGHAIHGLLSDVTYPSLAGTSVPRDYVEFPSQVHENWLATPEVLNRYALHVETGEPIPQALVDKIEAAGTFNQGFATAEYLASALVDMKLHTLADASDVDPDAFERETLAALGMPAELPMRHRTPQFSHVFSGEGYAASYYAYLWADTFGADAWEAFTKGEGGAWDRATADAFIENVLSVGNTIDPEEGYRAFRGGEDVDVEALMRQRGFSE